ncbi:MAG: DNA internalization-related competence protein ComEC/Rec2 [Sandaracinaceae bacterium]
MSLVPTRAGSAPLVAMAAGLLAGAWLAIVGLRIPSAWMGGAIVIAVGGAIAAGAVRTSVRPNRRAIPLFFLLAALIGQALAPYPPVDAACPAGVARVRAEVVRARGGPSDGCVVRVIDGAALEDGRPLRPGALLTIRGIAPPRGARVRFVARLTPAARFVNPTPHPPWPSSTTVVGHGRARGAPIVERPAPAFERALHAVRTRVRRSLQSTLSPRSAALARTLLLGESASLDDETRDTVRGAGLSHVLAVSGLHVALLAGALVALLRLGLSRIPPLARAFSARRASRAAGVVLALGYAALVGDAPSAWRAAITASIVWALEAMGRRPSPPAAFAGAVIVLALVAPEDLGRPGLVLSVAATAAILRGATLDGASALARGLGVAVRCTVATAPWTAWIFGSVPLGGLASNLVVVPFAAAALLPALVVHATVGALIPGLAGLTAPFAELACDAFVALASVFDAIEWGRDLPPLSVPQGIVLGVACTAVLLARGWRSRVAIVVAAVLAFGALELALRHAELPEGELRVTFLDVGQGDGALVDLPDGSLMVIDAGGAPGGGPDPGERVLVPLLRARRRARIDVLVVSHPHPDHYGGVSALLARFDVGEIWDTGQAADEVPDGPWAAVLTSARARGVRVRGPEELCDRTFRYGRASARVHHPCPRFDPGWGPNDNSLVVELRLGARRFLFTGDAEAHAESILTRLGVEPVDVLKVGHHGSRTSSSEELLARVRPTIAVVSAGRHNRFGHPHAEVIERLRSHAQCVLRLDRAGGQVVRTDGTNLEAAGCGMR